MTMRLIFLDVGNADSIIVMMPNYTAIVVDAPKPRKVLDKLQNENTSEIDSIYYTHDHHDHLPSLTGVVNLIENWRRQKKPIRQLYLPTRVLRKVFVKEFLDPITSEVEPNLSFGEDNVGSSDDFPGDDNPGKKRTSTNSRKKDLLRHALDKIELWNKERSPQCTRAEVGSDKRILGDVALDILHPDMLFVERILAQRPGKINETSLVLRLEYAAFSALLTGDVEGEGLRRLLNTPNAASLRCTLLKVPHHGAWHGDGQGLKELLSHADPEIAVLSVGSRNPHGHVAEGLFAELWRIKLDDGCRLKDFICTEATPTCYFPVKERGVDNEKRSIEVLPCAGDIEIVVDNAGNWHRLHEEVHLRRIDSIVYAACRPRPR